MSRWPNSSSAAYSGRRVALGTKHGKDRALRPALFALCGLEVAGTSALDTDALGTFTGEVPRFGSMLDAAREKARRAMAELGLPLGIGSEGSFGPHPLVPWLPSGTETLVFIDEERGLEIVESAISEHTNFAALTLTPETDLPEFLTRIGFPAHAVVVSAPGFIEKGIMSAEVLDRALRDALPLGPVRVETDMRAHLNPTRMAEIARLAHRLATRLSTPCPACGQPGFGETGVERGLPCADCGTPTSAVRAHIHSCPACGYSEARLPPGGPPEADPGHCPACNP